MDKESRSDVVEYIKKNLSRGYSSVSLKWALVQQGHSKVMVERALEKARKEIDEAKIEKKEKPKIKYQIYGEDNRPIRMKKPILVRIKDFFRNA